MIIVAAFFNSVVSSCVLEIGQYSKTIRYILQCRSFEKNFVGAY